MDDRTARLRARFGMAQAAMALDCGSDSRVALEGFLMEAPADDPRVPWAELRRGELLLRAQRWDVAQEAFEAARASGLPGAPEAHIRLGDLHRVRGEWDQAVEDYIGATYLYPATPWAALGLQGAARSYLDRGMTREAGILLEKLVRRPGTDPQLTRWARDELARLAPAAPARPRPAGTRS